MELSELGKKANEIEDEIGLTIDDLLNKITQEVGEFNDAVQKYRGRYCKTRTENTEQIQIEVGDLFFNIISTCSRLGINPNQLPQYAKNTLDKFYERRQLYVASLDQNKTQ